MQLAHKGIADSSDLEICVIDDGSSDQSYQVAREFLDDGILLKLDTNKGRSFARNKGMEVATGDFISFLDADDIYLSNYFETFLETYNVFPNIDFFTFSFSINGLSRERKCHYLGKPYSYSKKHYFCTNTIIIKNTIARQLRFNESMNRGEDIDFFNQIFQSEFEGIHTNIVISDYLFDYKDSDYDSLLISLKAFLRDYYYKNQYFLSLFRPSAKLYTKVY